ncbi:NAD(P)H-dependent D-xylose reductase xyl1 [Pestalotiopsis fici W106-1]|uniref:NAD(P)H-dependent D-xylose reductase xyl1 n=1 Tax=Pestalotiopsis fici (strain W106-1 / CGMCC3.15140) TaxID=1229662 RepID=W3XPG2_PESFW|nr:NAD(P)H-dependent D-xylose reductase xyl1 [Pestalotiopsis fici W106-1]ETS87859.1 NAD(P)H-dependent D-xylose reductase xyl1 [Pestalotiopsis fici W106-1]
MNRVPTVKLSSGYEMPLVGFGIWKVPREECADAVYNAIKMGYRHIDGAHNYTNSLEAGVGVRRAIDEGIVKRQDLFITSKLWNTYHRYDIAIQMAKNENEKWNVGYIDLFLIHFPIAQQYIDPNVLEFPTFWSDDKAKIAYPLERVPLSETWSALETLVQTKDRPDGILRSLGVANFNGQLLYDLLSYAKVPVASLQIEHHPYLVQPELVKMAQENGVSVTAYSSFGPLSYVGLDGFLFDNARAMTPLFQHPTVLNIARSHKKTPAQVLLRWATQRNIAVIPKSNSLDRLQENLECCSFDMTREELAQISRLDNGTRFIDPGLFGIHIHA